MGSLAKRLYRAPAIVDYHHSQPANTSKEDISMAETLAKQSG